MGDNPGRRQSRCEPYPYPEISYYGSRFVGWIHRSAYDYLFPPDGQPSPAQIDNGGHTETLKLMAQTALELWMIMPSFAAVSLESGGDQQHEGNFRAAIALCAELACAGKSQVAESLMDVLYMHVSRLDPRDMPSERNICGSMAEQSDHSASIFWSPVYQYYPDYLTFHFDRMVADLPRLTQLASMLSEIGDSLWESDHDDQGVALFPKDHGGWSSYIWKGHCVVSSPTLLRLRLLQLICERARPLNTGISDDQNGYKTFLQFENMPSIAFMCIPSMIQLDLHPKEQPNFFLELIEVMRSIMDDRAGFTGPTSLESYGLNGAVLNRDTANCLWSLFTAVKARLYMGRSLQTQKPWPYELLPEYRLMFRVPWQLILLSPGARYPHMFIHTASESKTVIPLDLSILCIPHTNDSKVETRDSIEFHLRADIAETLASMLAWGDYTDDGVQPYIYGSDEEFDNLLESILDDIRANQQGLNSTQQLTMLAHIDHCLKDFRPETHSPSATPIV
ncbi:hypothetical protein LTS10_009344 [Elasticomyces elasticus]|nr:hypothetical protein LTS10_009344 [Elasticomyces elasticus]